MSGAALAVALIVPVQRSSTQNAFSVNALSSRYTQQGEGNGVERSFKLRVKEVSKAVVDEMIPGVLKVIGELSESPDHAAENTVRGAEQSFRKTRPAVRLQQTLSRAGFDPGPAESVNSGLVAAPPRGVSSSAGWRSENGFA